MNHTQSKKSPFGGFRGLLTWLRKTPLRGVGGLVVGGLLLLAGCKEEGRNDLYDVNAPAPAQVENVRVRNTPGGAVLKYTLPKDENLRYVRAEYEIRPGVIRECKSSYYNDSLILEGFGDTLTYDVKIYSVGKNEKASAPLTEQIKPEKAPIHWTSKSLEATFSGIRVKIQNPLKTNLAIELMGDTANLGYQISLQTFYTNLENTTFAFRGLDTIAGDFSVFMRDRWGNLSDTINERLKPLYSEYISHSTWEEVNLPNDAYLPLQEREQYKPYNMWNDDYLTQWVCYASREDNDMPQWITWDLGVTAVLNRLKIWHHPTDTRIYGYNSPKKFELYGSMAPNPDGSWDDKWIPLGKFETLPPSGSIPPTVEDMQFALNGIECEFEENDFAPNPFVPVRYLRFKTIETFNGPRLQDGVWIKQIDFWGTIQK